MTLLPPPHSLSNTGYGQFITLLCHSLPPPLFPYSHRIQSFINFSHVGLSHRLQFLPENFFLHGLLSTVSFKVYPWAARRISAPLWTYMGYRGTTCFIMVFPMGCKGTSASALGAPSSPSFFTDPAGLFNIFSLLSYSCFLNMLLQRHYQRCWRACLWPAVGLSWSCLTRGQPLMSSHKRHPCSPRWYKKYLEDPVLK